MQVSWIDADRIKALVAQIVPQEASVEEPSSLVEIDTAPAAALGDGAETWAFTMDWAEPSVPPVPAAPEVAAPVTAGLEPPHQFAETESEVEFEGESESETERHGQSIHNAAAALPLSRIRDKLRAIRQRATEAGILTRLNEVTAVPASGMAMADASADGQGSDTISAGDCRDEATHDAVPNKDAPLTATLPQAPAFEIPAGSRDIRLAAFAGWARQLLQEDSGHVLVMSDDGEVLWGGEAKAGLVLSTMMAWGAAIRASAMSACETPPVIHQPLASGNVLTVIPCETPGGMVHAAVAAPAGLSNEQAALLRGALCAAMR